MVPPLDAPNNGQPTPPGLRLTLLGAPRVWDAAAADSILLGPGKSLAMLAYLATRGASRRDELMSLLWGDIPEDKARNAFRQSLHRLRSLLGEAVLPQSRDLVTLRTDAGLLIDRDAFLASCEAGRWLDAVSWYGGEFLAGDDIGEPAFDRWADSERVRLRARYQDALRAAADAAAAEGRVDEALRLATALGEAAPFDEEAAVFAASTLVSAGRSHDAVEVLRAFAVRLRDELDLPLPAAAKSLLERLERRPAKVTPTSNRAAERSRTHPFVGRAAELSRMLAAAGALRDERGATLVVEGAAGSGKTRLLDEFVERLRSLGAVTVLRGRESGLGGVIPYAGVADALRGIVRAPGVAGASRHLLAEAARLLPELRDNFDLPATTSVDDDAGRLRFFEGIAAVIDASAYERPICIIIDDAQHVSPPTADLIVYLSRRLHESPVLLVVSLRSDRAGAHVAERLREAGGDDMQIELGALSADESLQLARELTRGRVDAEELSRIARLSNGRPFAIVDLCRRATTGDLPSEAPATLHDVLWARLQASSPSQRRIFFAASLFERPASLSLLAAAAHLPEPAALDATQELLRDGLLREGDGGYVVGHDTATAFLLESSGLAGRALLAGWAADALAAEPDRTDAELASLYAMAGRAAEAFNHARAGAFVAASVGAVAEVMRLLGIALTFAPGDEARAQIESLLATFGRGRLSLPPSSDTDDETIVVEPVVDESAPTTFDAADAVEAQRGAETSRSAPAPRWNAGTRRQWVMAVLASALIVVVGLEARSRIVAAATARNTRDTLFLQERDARGRTMLVADVHPSVRNAGELSDQPIVAPPAWADSLQPPFSNALRSPDRQRVAVQRATPHGADILVISADRRDTIAVAVNGSDNAALGWSPDGRALLVSRTRTLRDGSFDSDLYVYWLAHPSSPIAIDTAASRSIAEATWSPTGASVAWVARVGPTHQREVFVSAPDGSRVRNVSANSADDYDASWSPDGSLLAFTSSRGDGPRLYVYDFDQDRLWPVSDRSGESHAVFSPDSRQLAFESTRDGDYAVYVRAALGGAAHRLTPRNGQFSIVSWRGVPPKYVDRLRIIGPTTVGVGDSLRLGALQLAADGSVLERGDLEWTLLDSGTVRLSRNASVAAEAHLDARRPGDVRVVASIPGWRADTLALSVSSAAAVRIADDFAGHTLDPRWLPLGQPAPIIGRGAGGEPALFPNGDLEWESGVLLRQPLELRPGLHLTMQIEAPFEGPPSAASLSIAFVAPPAPNAIDRAAPSFTSMVAARWSGASEAFTYAVGADSSSNRLPADGSRRHVLEIDITSRRDVVFRIDGADRWRSSLHFLGEAAANRVQLWIGGRATGTNAAIEHLRLDVPGRDGAADAR